jgi:hypothetical protein
MEPGGAAAARMLLTSRAEVPGDFCLGVQARLRPAKNRRKRRSERNTLATSQTIERIGRGEWIRTTGLLVPNQALYQAEPRPDYAEPFHYTLRSSGPA